MVQSLILLPALAFSAVAGDWRGFFNADLRAAEGSLTKHRTELAALGNPVVGNTVPQLGYQTNQKPAPPPESPWVQVDLGSTQRLDQVALVPVIVDFQPIERGAYGFPRRFRVDVSNDASFSSFAPLLVHTDDDFPPPGIGPVVIPAGGCEARYIRVTVTRLAEENKTFFYALAELIALQGNRNVALGGKVSGSDSVNIAPRWNMEFLTDGRTPLGPPIRRGVLPQFDAIFAAMGPDKSPAWMAVDLSEEKVIEEVRLHPLHARQGADVPGFRFPARFRVELASGADFSDARILFENRDVDFPNPGNNPVTIQATGQSGRHLRVVMLKGETPEASDFSLSEFEVQAGGRRVSDGCTVTTSGDERRHPPRPQQDLTDGSTSYGRLVELPVWLDEWARRAALQSAIRDLDATVSVQTVVAQRRAALTAVMMVLLTGGCAGVLVARNRRVRFREQERFRTRLAQDLHDEIGSNLAGIAVLSETAATQGDANEDNWREIHRIAHESSEAMREVLWLVGSRQETGIDLGQQMQTAAARLLPGRTIRWAPPPDSLPSGWSMDTRRQIFLFFKEALTNVVRHSGANEVEISTLINDGMFELLIRDNGRGFDVATAPTGVGLKSLRDRAASLRGVFVIESIAGSGTVVSLKLPVPTL